MTEKRNKKTAEGNKAIGYCRVSTIGQAEEGISLDAQVARIRAYCQMKELELIDIKIDAGVSAGKNPLIKREGGEEILRAIQNEKAFHIVSVKLDRLFRNTIECLAQVQTWDKSGVGLHLIDMGGASIETTSAMGKMFLTMAAGFAEMESNLASERTITALSRKTEKNECTGEIPYGKRLSADNIHLEKHPDEQAVISLVKNIRTTGLSQRAIAKELNNQGLVNRAGGTFNQTQIARMLIR